MLKWLIVVLAYARLPRRGTPPPRTVLLVGRPWQARVLLPVTGPMPEEVRLIAPEVQACYRHRADNRDRPWLRMLRYEPVGGPSPADGLQRPEAP